eukprot:2011965-Amphidinium_carterae.1
MRKQASKLTGGVQQGVGLQTFAYGQSCPWWSISALRALRLPQPAWASVASPSLAGYAMESSMSLSLESCAAAGTCRGATLKVACWGLGVAGPSFHGGGRPQRRAQSEPPTMSVGQQLQRLKQVESRLTTAQMKGVLAASPKLQKLLLKAASGPAIADQLQHDLRRMAITPQLGSAQPAKPQSGQGWRNDTRKARVELDQKPLVSKVVRLVKDQIFAAGKALPVRTTLLGNQAAVAIFRSPAELRTAITRAGGSVLPQAAVTDKLFDVGDDIKQLQTPPHAVTLEFQVVDAGDEHEFVQLPCYLWHIAGQPLEVQEVAELVLRTQSSAVLKVQWHKALLHDQGHWVPYGQKAVALRQHIKDVALAVEALLLDMWTTKDGGPKDTFAYVRVKTSAVGVVIAELTQARLAVTPPKSWQAHTVVTWMKGVSTYDLAAKTVFEATDGLRELPLADGLQWIPKASMVIRAGIGGGKPTFGVAVPREHAPRVQSVLGAPHGKRWVLRGTSRDWLQSEIEEVLASLKWSASVIGPLGQSGRVWILRSDQHPHRARVAVKKVILTIDEFKVKGSRSDDSTAVDVARAPQTWASILRCDVQAPLPRDEEEADPGITAEDLAKLESVPEYSLAALADAQSEYDGMDCGATWDHWEDEEL